MAAGSTRHIETRLIPELNPDASSSAITAGATSLTWAHVCATDNNRLLVVGISLLNALGQTVTGITYNGVALTAVPGGQVSNGTGGRAELWFLIAPVVGSNNIVATFSASVAAVGGAESWVGSDQTAPLGTAVTASGNTSDATVTVIGAVGQFIQDVVASAAVGITVGAGQTEEWNTGVTGLRGAGSREPGAASVVMDWTSALSALWAIVGVPVLPVSTAATTNAAAVVAAVTVASLGASVTVAPSAGLAAVATAAGGGTGSVAPGSGSAGVSGAAGGAQGTVASSASVASVGIAARDASAAQGVNAGIGGVGSAAGGVTAAIASLAASSAVSAASGGPGSSVSGRPGAATVGASSPDPDESVAPHAGIGAVGAAALDATSTSGVVANAQVAPVAVAALGAHVNIAPHAGVAAVTAAALDATASMVVITAPVICLPTWSRVARSTTWGAVKASTTRGRVAPSATRSRVACAPVLTSVC